MTPDDSKGHLTENPSARLKHPIDADHYPDDSIEYWHADSRDFIDVAWTLRHKGVIPRETNAQDVSEAFRGSEAVQAHALLYAAALILDGGRLAEIQDRINEAVKIALAKAARRKEPQMATAHLIAAVATVIRDTPATEPRWLSLQALLDAASSDSSAAS